MMRFQNEDFILETTFPMGEDLPGITTLVHPQYAEGNPITIDIHFGELEAKVAHEEWVDRFLQDPPTAIMDQVSEATIIREHDDTRFKLMFPDL